MVSLRAFRPRKERERAAERPAWKKMFKPQETVFYRTRKSNLAAPQTSTKRKESEKEEQKSPLMYLHTRRLSGKRATNTFVPFHVFSLFNSSRIMPPEHQQARHVLLFPSAGDSRILIPSSPLSRKPVKLMDRGRSQTAFCGANRRLSGPLVG